MYFLITLIFPVLHISCGIQEYFYLPQVDQFNINRILNDSAEINIPVPGTEFYYFRNYAIYYKIYVSEHDSISTINPLGEVLEEFSDRYKSDYNQIRRYADPTNTAFSTSIDQLFRNLNYYALNFDGVGKNNQNMLPPGNILRIIFPTGHGETPYAILDGSAEAVPITRSTSELSLISLIPDQYFINSDELREYAADNANADVARILDDEGVSKGEFTYVSMYIVAVGFDLSTITEIFSKPTFINLFKMN